MTQISMPFVTGDPSTIEITKWQEKYAEAFGNKPTLSYLENGIDELGAACQKVRYDVQEFRFYQDIAKTKLDRIKAITGTGVLENNLTITIK